MTPPASPTGSVWEVFRVFLKLGLTSFGGPIAHLGYFRAELVTRRGWLDDREYAELVALCQFLPGPASSQVGFGIGLRRAGLGGAISAFLAFTLPSAALMVVFAFGASLFASVIGMGALAGLKIVAVAIVAQAVVGMARTLTPDLPRVAIAGGAIPLALLLLGSAGQFLAIALGGLIGLWLCRDPARDLLTGGTRQTRVNSEQNAFRISRRVGLFSLVVFASLLVLLPLTVSLLAETPPGRDAGWGGIALFDASYRAGALVFGGGHVVLPLLHAGMVEPGWITDQQFLAGYGAAQALPGPLFTFAAYLGALAEIGPGGILGAAIGLLGIFLPGFLLLVGVLPFWDALRRRPRTQAAMRGANAAVVGILAAAFYDPVFVSAITAVGPFLLALACFVLLVTWKLPPWLVVIVGACGGILLTLLG